MRGRAAISTAVAARGWCSITDWGGFGWRLISLAAAASKHRARVLLPARLRVWLEGCRASAAACK